MKLQYKVLNFFLVTVAIALTVFLFPYFYESAVFSPKGLIALQQRDIIYVATMQMLVIVIPVLILAFIICIRYRASNKQAEYHPNWDHDAMAETVWWGFPFLVVVLLSIVTWKSSHDLDPYKPLQKSIEPVKIQVVALQWKWLFIYPEHNVASVNFFQFPVLTPITFEITADAPMNSFWIPQLGGQIYAMPGMRSKLHLIANEVGDYRGSSANLSGKGFAGMTFTAKASTPEDFKKWVELASSSSNGLGKEDYQQLVKPSEYNPAMAYSLKDSDLFNQILMKYMMPMTQTQETGPSKTDSRMAYE